MKLALVAAIALAAAPAQAQLPTCDFLKRLVKEAPSEFAAYRGAPVAGMENVYLSKLTPRGHVCMLMNTPQDASFLCYSSYMAPDAARKIYDSDLAGLRACFPGLPELPPVPPRKGDPLKFDRGVRLVQEIGGHELNIGLIAGLDDRKTPAQSAVSFGLVWKKLTTGS